MRRPSLCPSAVSGIPCHEGNSCRLRPKMIVTAGNPGLPTHVATWFLSPKLRNAYHPPRTRTYHDSGHRASDRFNVIPAHEPYEILYFGHKDRKDG
jgi:hypothetical protein